MLNTHPLVEEKWALFFVHLGNCCNVIAKRKKGEKQFENYEKKKEKKQQKAKKHNLEVEELPDVIAFL